MGKGHKVASTRGRDMEGAAVDLLDLLLESSWWRLESDLVEQIHFLFKYDYKDYQSANYNID